MTKNRFSENIELELEATRKLLDLTRGRLMAAVYTITELETLLELSKPESSQEANSANSKSE